MTATVPRAAGSEPPAAEPETAGIEHPVVLVAEDSRVVRALVRAQLSRQGYEVLEAEDGILALAMFRECGPDVVLLDVEMPGLDGLQVLEAIKASQIGSDTPVVFLTARERTQDLVEALDRGAHDYLRKPFEPSELTARVRAAVRVKRLQDELRSRNAELDAVSRTDPLTGLWNRRHVQEQIPGLASAARRLGKAISGMMIDIDHFKRVNDSEGHAAGDVVLRRVASLVRDSLRTEDVVARWGGEEFLVVAPFTDQEGAGRLGERIRAMIEAEPFPLAGADHRVTVSIGTATVIAGEQWEETVTRADQALYRAKAEGRNRVIQAEE